MPKEANHPLKDEAAYPSYRSGLNCLQENNYEDAINLFGSLAEECESKHGALSLEYALGNLNISHNCKN